MHLGALFLKKNNENTTSTYKSFIPVSDILLKEVPMISAVRAGTLG